LSIFTNILKEFTKHFVHYGKVNSSV